MYVLKKKNMKQKKKKSDKSRLILHVKVNISALTKTAELDLLRLWRSFEVWDNYSSDVTLSLKAQTFNRKTVSQAVVVEFERWAECL